MTDNTMSDDEKIVRESIIHGKAWCIETEAAFDRLMAIAPHGEMKSAEEWADMLAMKGLERNDMRNVVISIQQDALASRTTTGDETYAERREREKLFKRNAYITMRKAILGAFEFREPSAGAWNEQFTIVTQTYHDLVKDLPESAAPTHDAVRDA